MVGIELVEEKNTRKNYPPATRIGYQVILEARKRGVIIRPLGDVIVLMPPLTIANSELETLLDVVYESIKVVTEGR
jgi:adenosylmethionine-8-amino-7-oxononanoate aminotransferase